MEMYRDRPFPYVKSGERLATLVDTEEETDADNGVITDADKTKPAPVRTAKGAAQNGSGVGHTGSSGKPTVSRVSGDYSNVSSTVTAKNNSSGDISLRNSTANRSSGVSSPGFSSASETLPLISPSASSPSASSPSASSPSSPQGKETPQRFFVTSVSASPPASETSPGTPSSIEETSSPFPDVDSLKNKINEMTSSNSLGTSKNSSLPDFSLLKSAMRHSSDDPKKGKRKMSLLNTVMRRVSIHRKESTPSGRIATFFFGASDDAVREEESGEDSKGEGDVDHKHDGHHDPHSEKAALDKRHGQPAVLKESLFMILSGLYGVVIVILGAVIPITEIFVKNNEEQAFEAFYLYLYVVSIIFLVYVYAYLLRRNRLKTEFLTRTLSRSMSWTRNWAKSWAKADEATKGKLRKRMISLDVSNHHTGTFYLRLGVLGFGIGSMIHSGLNFGTFFAVTDENCSDPLDAVKPLFHLVFTFFQLYFIFMNSKMCIHRYKKLARFGLMHMCATNICVWFRSIVVETLHVIHMHQHASHHGHDKPHDASGSHTSHDNHSPQDGHTSQDTHHGDGHTNLTYQILNATVNVGRKLHAAAAASSPSSTNGSKSSTISDSCQGSGMMSQAVEAAGPYLYPCTIEYSLMCAGILYIMWKNVGNKPRRLRQSELEDDDDDQRVHRMSVDCTGSSRGLFLGILMMVGTIISIIAFYMLVNTEELHSSAIILTHLSETFIYAVTLFAIIMAAIKMKNLTFHNEHEADLEDILVLISYTGLLVFIIFSLVASILHEADTRSALTILSNITMLIQSTAQTIFMLAGDRMTASTELHERKKPGREFITFLLISNFAMWAVNTFETQTPQHNPIQVEFYGPEAWAIFTHVSVPLGIYYRFHSTVCFSNIWKNAWKVRKHDHH